MKTKMIALALSAALFANPLAAFAQSSSPQLVDLSKMDPAMKAQIPQEILNKLLNSSQKKTVEDLRSTLATVDAMLVQLDSLQKKSGEDLFLNYAKKVQAALVLFNAYAVKLHLKDKGASDVVAYLTVASAAVNMMIRHWNPATSSFDWMNNQGRIDPKMVIKVLDESTKEIASRPGLPPEVTEALASLGQLKGNVDLQKNRFVEMLEESGGGWQDAAAGVSALSILIHLVSPKLAKYADKVMTKAMPVVQQTKRGGSVGALAADAPDIIGATLGMSSEAAQVMILKTMGDLNTTKKNIETSIRCQSMKPEQRRESSECSAS